MDTNLILLLTTGVAAAISVVRFAQLRAVGYRGWMATSAFMLGVIALGIACFPAVAGYVAFGLWTFLFLIPSLGGVVARRYMLRQDFARARRVTLVLRWLHPFDGWSEQPELLRALDGAFRGDL